MRSKRLHKKNKKNHKALSHTHTHIYNQRTIMKDKNKIRKKIQYGQQVSVHQRCRLNLGILDVSSRRRITSKKQETRGSRYGDRKKYFDGMNIFVVFWL